VKRADKAQKNLSCDAAYRLAASSNGSPNNPMLMKGKVYLVGAGPGDPELLTMKACRILGEAQVVLHDDLVNPEILRFAPPLAHIRNVGKRCGQMFYVYNA
jgi:Tetrapyrrole (Corrin/Porphyrin) Methylases